MKHLFIVFGLVIVQTIATIGNAETASVYSTDTTATLSLTANPFIDLQHLEYLGSSANYRVEARATADGNTVVSKDGTSFNRTGPQVSFGDYFDDGKNLGDLLLKSAVGTDIKYPAVSATNKGAISWAGSGTNTHVTSAGFKVSTKGKATDPVEEASSSVSLDLLLAFKNTSVEDLTIYWLLHYAFENVAIADPRGTAYSESLIRVQSGKISNGVKDRNTKITTLETAACGVTTAECNYQSTPGEIEDDKTFQITLKPNEIWYFNIYLTARGRASVVPLPASLPLFGSGLAVIGFFAWRKKRKAASSNKQA